MNPKYNPKRCVKCRIFLTFSVLLLMCFGWYFGYQVLLTDTIDRSIGLKEDTFASVLDSSGASILANGAGPNAYQILILLGVLAFVLLSSVLLLRKFEKERAS